MLAFKSCSDSEKNSLPRLLMISYIWYELVCVDVTAPLDSLRIRVCAFG